MVALGLLILRLVIGLTVAGHGAQKLFGWWGGPGMNGWVGAMNRMRIRPAVPWAWVSALAELLGGLGLAIGLLTPLPSLAIAGSMLVAIALVHWPRGFWATKGGYEFNLSILAGIAAIALTGPGAYSLDAAFGIHLPEPLTLIAGTILLLIGVAVALGTRAPEQLAETKPQTT
ncbi:MAG: DoxX family protein [Chloroflexi bacterium]|nr:MAG: DoxX family protein [Chloroflexota bacterium]TMF33985.1 MAG: DoxX family protein [Chloroflexota bacterium]